MLVHLHFVGYLTKHCFSVILNSAGFASVELHLDIKEISSGTGRKQRYTGTFCIFSYKMLFYFVLEECSSSDLGHEFKEIGSGRGHKREYIPVHFQ